MKYQCKLWIKSRAPKSQIEAKYKLSLDYVEMEARLHKNASTYLNLKASDCAHEKTHGLRLLRVGCLGAVDNALGLLDARGKKLKKKFQKKIFASNNSFFKSFHVKLLIQVLWFKFITLTMGHKSPGT